jgi:hypothetical protein
MTEDCVITLDTYSLSTYRVQNRSLILKNKVNLFMENIETIFGADFSKKTTVLKVIILSSVFPLKERVTNKSLFSSPLQLTSFTFHYYFLINVAVKISSLEALFINDKTRIHQKNTCNH